MMSQTQYKIVSAAEMRLIEARAVQDFGISTLILMEHAGTAIADIAEQHFLAKHPAFEKPLTVVLCGKGSNGGDGFTAARHLFNRGWSVEVFVASDFQSLKGDALINYKILDHMGVPIFLNAHENKSGFQKSAAKASLILDALFGTGLEREVAEPYLGLIMAINESGKPVLSADLPSGLHADSGKALPLAVKASVTAALGLPKQGFYAADGPSLSGKIYIVDIGLPRFLVPVA